MIYLISLLGARAAAAMIEPTNDSNKSAPIPATSPTLSPTLSAITAGLRGSSSGISISIFPTRSAPTSAAFVYIPPATLANKAIDEAPNPKPARLSTANVNLLISSLCPRVISQKNNEIPKRPRPTTVNPITAPPVKATRSAAESPSLSAACVVRTFTSVATIMPPYHVIQKKNSFLALKEQICFNLNKLGTHSELTQPEAAESMAPARKHDPMRTPSIVWPVGGSRQ
mmetsp:Transcript_32212/g.32475  ORF Transcript_32212/g.32475 Transcript_32212/m.32475 type:complete len:228 (+) Transcript_32212:1414-2097(+)